MKEHEKDHHAGLVHDLEVMAKLADRRQILRLVAGLGFIPILGTLGCGDASTAGADDAGSRGGDGGNGDGGSTPKTCPSNIPEETAGPYPGDGSNGPNALTTSGIVRSDIRSSFGSMTGVAAGVPLTIKLTVVNISAACAALAGYAVYLWHCDRDGKYSLYSVANENYLRGVQETDENGTVTFTSIFPAAYSGRWPHIHFELFASLANATAAGSKVRTSQLAMPVDASNTVFATAGYEQSVSNMAQSSLATDNVFNDGSSLQLPTITGTVAAGYVATLTVGVAV